MLNVELIYNPYFVKTEIVIDGDPVPGNSRLAELCKSERIQNWIDKFLPVLYDERREKNVCFTFHGTELDADDVRNALELFNAAHPGFNFTLKEVESKKSGVNRVTELKALFEKGKEGPFRDTFNSPEMQAAFERALDPTFEVNVIATMSAGKSTVVNSLLGKKLMPAKHQACTATIARIKDNDAAPLFTAQRFDKHGAPLSEIQEATYDLLSAWNDDPRTSIIEIEGNIPTVKQTDECTMVFVDTPGPNNSRSEEHKRITLETIKSKPLSMVLYVLNATQLSTDDDRWLLDQVCTAMSAGGRQAQDRFVFLANQIDVFDPEDGESVTKALKDVREYLQCRDENGKILGIENPLIIPVSAILAQQIRIKRTQGSLKERAEQDLKKLVSLFVNEKEMNMVDHTQNRLNSDCVRRLRDRINSAKNDEELAEILSGIPIVEELLNDFLQKHAMPAKLKDAVDSLDRVMQEAKIAEKMNAQLAKDDAEIAKVVSKINAFTEDRERIGKGRVFRDKIKAMKYSISEQTEAHVLSLSEKCEKVVHDLTELLQNSRASKLEATHAFEKAAEQCKQFDAEVMASLSAALKTEYYSVMKAMRDDYQDYVVSVLKESFPDDEGLQELQGTVMEMPSVQEMIDTNLKTESQRVCVGSHEVSNSTWWKPWTWFSTRTVNDYETRTVEYVDLTPIAAELSTSLRSSSQHNIDGFRDQATVNVESAKDTLLAIMDTIDKKIEDIQAKLLEAQNDHAAKEAMRQKNQEKLDWYNDFCRQLQDILAV